MYAERRTNVLPANLWAVATLLFVFGFSDYRPQLGTFLVAVMGYYAVGATFAVKKWVNLVDQVKLFCDEVGPHSDPWMVRHLAYKRFEPNDAVDGVMTLPPDPHEFRTRLMLWFGFWPSFTVLRFLTHFHKKVASVLWDKFHKVSIKIYEGRN